MLLLPLPEAQSSGKTHPQCRSSDSKAIARADITGNGATKIKTNKYKSSPLNLRHKQRVENNNGYIFLKRQIAYYLKLRFLIDCSYLWYYAKFGKQLHPTMIIIF